MATLEEMKAQYRELETQADLATQQHYSIRHQMEELDLKIRQATYTCPCVHQNKELDIWDMSQQRDPNRKPLGLGMVYDTLTADKNCPHCSGTGIPPEQK